MSEASDIKELEAIAAKGTPNRCLATTIAFTFPDQNLAMPGSSRNLDPDFFTRTLETLLNQNPRLKITAHLAGRQPNQPFKVDSFYDPELLHFKTYEQVNLEFFSSALEGRDKAWITFFLAGQPEEEAASFHTFGLIRADSDKFKICDTLDLFGNDSLTSDQSIEEINDIVAKSKNRNSPVIIHSFA